MRKKYNNLCDLYFAVDKKQKQLKRFLPLYILLEKIRKEIFHV